MNKRSIKKCLSIKCPELWRARRPFIRYLSFGLGTKRYGCAKDRGFCPGCPLPYSEKTFKNKTCPEDKL
jgi:hypothetical protein